MKPVKLISKFKSNSSLISKIVDRKVIILDPEAGEVRNLNTTASLIWREINRGKPVSEVIDKVSKSFFVKTGQAKEDVIRFLGKFEEQGLLKRINEK